MAKYIEGKSLLNALKEERKKGNFVFTEKWIKEIIDDLPTVDVVPKSEVEELKAIIADHKASEERLEELYSNAKTEVAREIFEEIEKMLENQEVVTKNQREKELGDWIFHNYIPKKIAELKKKYTEENNI